MLQITQRKCGVHALVARLNTADLLAAACCRQSWGS